MVAPKMVAEQQPAALPLRLLGKAANNFPTNGYSCTQHNGKLYIVGGRLHRCGWLFGCAVDCCSVVPDLLTWLA